MHFVTTRLIQHAVIANSVLRYSCLAAKTTTLLLRTQVLQLWTPKLCSKVLNSWAAWANSKGQHQGHCMDGPMCARTPSPWDLLTDSPAINWTNDNPRTDPWFWLCLLNSDCGDYLKHQSLTLGSGQKLQGPARLSQVNTDRFWKAQAEKMLRMRWRGIKRGKSKAMKQCLYAIPFPLKLDCIFLGRCFDIYFYKTCWFCKWDPLGDVLV